jgi:hypothetical protein
LRKMFIRIRTSMDRVHSVLWGAPQGDAFF